MCLSFQMQIDPVKILTDAFTGMARPLGYLKDPESRINRLKRAMTELRNQKEDLNDRVRSDELDGQKPTRQVQDWMAQVDDAEAKVSEILKDRQNGSFRWRINRRAEKRLNDIAELRRGAAAFEVVTVKPAPDGLAEVQAEHPVYLGMGPYLSQLQAYLRERPRIIGIWGMGGVGKTTLLQSLNNELFSSSRTGSTPRQFDHVIWAVASKEYKFEKLQQDIAQQLELPLRTDVVHQMRDIFEFLQDKSFLLLLDDLWQPVNFVKVGIPHPLRAGVRDNVKQKVVFTTRLQGVCAQMEASITMKMECLNDDDAWRLFQQKVGGETLRAHYRIPELAQQVAKECDGLPLALVVIGIAMSTKKTQKEWLNAITLLKKSQLDKIHDMDDKILPKLKFSYDNLADEIMRKCFLLCCLWPEDHSISKNDLIECWMGHGLVDERQFDNINEAYDSGHTLIGKLQAACLLERGVDENKEVKMHDVVRHLALWIASNCGEKPNKYIVNSGSTSLEYTQREVERISLVRSEVSDTSRLPVNCLRLETLMLQESISFKSIMTGFFNGTRTLTYLDVSYTSIYNLPSEIELIKNLQYLNLSHTNIPSLPWQLCYLQKLRFLLLRDLGSLSIPEGVIGRLGMLSVIDMTNTWCENWKEISTLHRRLKGVGIVLETIEALEQLAQYPNVPTWRLGLRKLVRFSDPLQLLSPMQLGSRSICSSIQMLKIEFCESLEVVTMENNGNGDSKNRNWCLSRLEEVELKSLPELKEIVWRGVVPVKMMPSLAVVKISGCGKLSNISWITGLPSLEELAVHHCAEIEQIIRDDDQGGGGGVGSGVVAGSNAFPSLRKLSLTELQSLRAFANGLLAFPSLQVLQVIRCPELKTLPFAPELAGAKLKEIWGDSEWWEELEMEDDARAALFPRFKKREPRYA